MANKRGRPPYSPTAEQRKTVKAMAAYGIPQEAIARTVGCNHETLRKYYPDELDLAETEANAKVAQSLFKLATNGNVAAAIFWAKARMGWSEKQQIELGSIDGKPLVTVYLPDNRRDVIK